MGAPARLNFEAVAASAPGRRPVHGLNLSCRCVQAADNHPVAARDVLGRGVDVQDAAIGESAVDEGGQLGDTASRMPADGTSPTSR